LEQAAEFANRGPLPPEVLHHLNKLWMDQTSIKS